jgi:hypothetical protein
MGTFYEECGPNVCPEFGTEKKDWCTGSCINSLIKKHLYLEEDLPIEDWENEGGNIGG